MQGQKWGYAMENLSGNITHPGKEQSRYMENESLPAGAFATAGMRIPKWSGGKEVYTVGLVVTLFKVDFVEYV